MLRVCTQAATTRLVESIDSMLFSMFPLILVNMMWDANIVSRLSVISLSNILLST